jgi:hypothetical protein
MTPLLLAQMPWLSKVAVKFGVGAGNRRIPFDFVGVPDGI